MIAGAGRKFALATSRVCISATAENKSAKVSMSANAVLFITAPYNNTLNSPLSLPFRLRLAVAVPVSRGAAGTMVGGEKLHICLQIQQGSTVFALLKLSIRIKLA